MLQQFISNKSTVLLYSIHIYKKICLNSVEQSIGFLYTCTYILLYNHNLAVTQFMYTNDPYIQNKLPLCLNQLQYK